MLLKREFTTRLAAIFPIQFSARILIEATAAIKINILHFLFEAK